MKTAIIYATKFGTTEKCAQKLREQLKGENQLINLKTEKNPDLKDFENVILGSSIKAGNLDGKMKKFVSANMKTLVSKKLGLFLCTLTPPEKAGKYLESCYPPELFKASKTKGCFGGEMLLEKMNFLERFILKKISGKDKSFSRINEEGITRFAGEFGE
jgi:menaquinone-dependent protoporphyrinogen oxidase